MPCIAYRPAAVIPLRGPSPSDALIKLKLGCRLTSIVPVRRGLHSHTDLRMPSSRSVDPRVVVVRSGSACAPM
jgi:hypothetical protein